MRTLELHRTGDVHLFLARGMEVGDLRSDPLIESNEKVERRNSGALIPIGGKASSENLKIVAEFVREGTDMTIITVPTGKPNETFEELDQEFRSANHYGEIHHLHVDTTRADAREMLGRSSVIYISGGDQERAVQVLTQSGIDNEIRDFHQRGNTVAGSSAGASMMGEYAPNGRRLIKGLGLTPLIFDQHTKERGREKRVEKVAGTTKRSTVGFNESSGGIIYQGRDSIEFFGASGGHVAWQPNGHVESTSVRSGQTIVVPVFTGDHAMTSYSQSL